MPWVWLPAKGRAAAAVLPNNTYASLDSQCYGPTEFDIRDRETISATYNIPGEEWLWASHGRLVGQCRGDHSKWAALGYR